MNKFQKKRNLLERNQVQNKLWVNLDKNDLMFSHKLDRVVIKKKQHMDHEDDCSRKLHMEL